MKPKWLRSELESPDSLAIRLTGEPMLTLSRLRRKELSTDTPPAAAGLPLGGSRSVLGREEGL